MIALEIEKQLAVEARERMTAGINQYSSPIQKVGEAATGVATKQAAKIVGTNHQYVSDAKKLEHEAPDLLDKVRSGDLSIRSKLDGDLVVGCLYYGHPSRGI